MSMALIQESTLNSIADAIREKTESTDLINPKEMANKILEIQSSVSVPETWVLNESITGEDQFQASINFTSNSETFTSIQVDTIVAGCVYYINASGKNTIWVTGWTDENYRKIVFETAPTGQLLEWLEQNAVKQDNVVEVSLKFSQNGPVAAPSNCWAVNTLGAFNITAFGTYTVLKNSLVCQLDQATAQDVITGGERVYYYQGCAIYRITDNAVIKNGM